MMTNDKSLSRDALFNDRTELMTPRQKNAYRIMQGVNHFINLALEGHREISTGKCRVMLYSEFLLELAKGFLKTQQIRDKCLSESETDTDISLAVHDDFIRIALYANNAIKNIIRDPSRQVTKVEVKQPASRVAAFTAKTMQWMSVRSGRNIAEKIAPENKILTTKTVFSVDTKENRELMYLYRNLARIVASRFSKTKCFHCSKWDSCGQGWLGDIKKMLSAFTRLKTEELGHVKAEKHVSQNNKLMCDLNYKIIWDATLMLTKVEENIKAQFDSVRERFAKLLYWLMLGLCLRYKGAKLLDRAGALYDDQGVLSFRGAKEEDDGTTDSDKIVFVSETNDLLREYVFSRNGTEVYVECRFPGEKKTDALVFDCGAVFDELLAAETDVGITEEETGEEKQCL